MGQHASRAIVDSSVQHSRRIVKRNDPHGHVRSFDKAEGRRPIRLKGYDYTQPGAYFVTVVTHERELLFEAPVFHRVAETMWQRISRHFPHVELDEWVVMPNCIHGIIVITDSVGATHSSMGASTEKTGSQYVTPGSAKQTAGNASPLHQVRMR
jgi:hypothetical protein